MARNIGIRLGLIDDLTRSLRRTVKDASSQFNQLEKSSRSVASTGNMLGNMGKTVSGAFRGIINEAALASAVLSHDLANALKSVIGTVSEFERFKIASEFLLDSAEAAEEFRKAMINVALSAPFAIDDINRLGLQTIGVTKNAEFAERAMTVLADTVVATGGGYAELSSSVRATIQTFAKANASAEEINRQFTNANIPAVRALAEAIAVDLNHPMRDYLDATGQATKGSKEFEGVVKGFMADLQDIGDFKIPGELVADSLLDGLDRLYGGAAQANLETFSGQWERFTESIRLSSAALMGLDESGEIVSGSLFDRLKNAVKAVNDVMVPARGAITAFGSSLAKNMPLLMGMVSFIVGLFIPVIMAFIVPLIKAGIIFGTIGVAIGFVVQAFQKLDEKLDITSRLTQLYNDKIGFLGDKFNWVKDRIGQFADEAKDRLQPLKNYIVFGGGEIGDVEATWTQVFDTILDRVKNKWQEIKNTIVGLDVGETPENATFEEAFSSFGNIVKSLPERAMIKINDIIDSNGIREEVEFVIRVIKRLFNPETYSAYIDQFKSKLPEVSEQFKVLVDSLMEMGKIFIPFFGLILAAVVSVFALIASIVLSIFTEVIGPVMKFFTGLIQIATGFMQIFVGLFTGNLKLIVQGFINMKDGVINIILHMVGSVTGIVVGFVKGIKNWFTLMFKTIGVELVSKFVSDFKNKWNSFIENSTSSIDGMVERVINKLKAFSGIAPTVIDGMAGEIAGILSGLAASAIEWGYNLIKSFAKGMINAAKSAGSAGKLLLDKMGFNMDDLSFQHGGIVPGRMGQAVPILAHAGERVVPRSGADVNGFGGSNNFTINFNGSINMDSEERVNELAEKISDKLGRMNELARYGAGV